MVLTFLRNPEYRTHLSGGLLSVYCIGLVLNFHFQEYALVLLGVLLLAEGLPRVRWHYLDFLILAYIAGIGISFLDQDPASYPMRKELIRYSKPMMIFWAIRWLAPDIPALRQGVITYLFLLVLGALYSYVNLWQGTDRIYGLPSGDTRAGLIMNFADFMLIVLSAAFAWIIITREKRNLLTGIILFLISGVALLYNQTRGAWLAAIIAPWGLVLVNPAWLTIRKLAMGFSTVLLSVLILTSFSASTRDSLNERVARTTNYESDVSSRYRLSMWKIAVDQFLENPLNGGGLSRYSEFKKQHPLFEAGLAKYSNPHSNPLHLAAGTGLSGLLSWLMLQAGWAWFLLGEARRSKEAHQFLASWAFIALLAISVHGLTETNLRSQYVYPALWFLTGAVFILRKANPPLHASQVR